MKVAEVRLLAWFARHGSHVVHRLQWEARCGCGVRGTGERAGRWLRLLASPRVDARRNQR